MSTKKTLIATAVALGLGLGGQAFAAENTENGAGENLQVAIDTITLTEQR